MPNFLAGILSHYHESLDCFKYLKRSVLKLSHPKKIFAKSSYPQNPAVENCKPMQKKIPGLSPTLEIWVPLLASSYCQESEALKWSRNRSKQLPVCQFQRHVPVPWTKIRPKLHKKLSRIWARFPKMFGWIFQSQTQAFCASKLAV